MQKANKSALIEVSTDYFDFACPECIADPEQIGDSCNINKIKTLIKYLKENNGLQIVTFVGHGEPLEIEGNRKITLELAKYANECGLIPLIYTGGHSLDMDAINFIKDNDICVLLSTYGLPFLKSDILSPSVSLNNYSTKKEADDGRKLLASQRELANMVYQLFKLKKTNFGETNLAISIVGTPNHFACEENQKQLEDFTTSAKSNGFAVYVWEEFRKGMDRCERHELELKSRTYSGLCEIGSLYLWNRCMFGTGGAVTVLGNGHFTHCPHTIQSAGFTIDDIVDEQNIVQEDGLKKLLNKAHEFDHLSCILRNTKRGERMPSVVPIENIIGGNDINEFIDHALHSEFTYIAKILGENGYEDIHIIINKIKKYFLEKWETDYLWMKAITRGIKNKKYFLSSAMRYIYDSKMEIPLWNSIVDANTGHEFHNTELNLLKNYSTISKKIKGQALVFFGLGEKEDIVVKHLQNTNIEIFLIDTRTKVVENKKKIYENMGYQVYSIPCFFEDIYDEFWDRNSKLNQFNSYTLVILGCTVGNFRQRSFWEKILEISKKQKMLQIIASLQVIRSEIKNDQIEKLNSIYDDKTFRSFISRPLKNEFELLNIYEKDAGKKNIPVFHDIKNCYNANIEEGLGGIVSNIYLNKELEWENPFGSNLKMHQGGTLEIYRSLKPDKNKYIKFLGNILGNEANIEILTESEDIVLYEILLNK